MQQTFLFLGGAGLIAWESCSCMVCAKVLGALTASRKPLLAVPAAGPVAGAGALWVEHRRSPEEQQQYRQQQRRRRQAKAKPVAAPKHSMEGEQTPATAHTSDCNTLGGVWGLGIWLLPALQAAQHRTHTRYRIELYLLLAVAAPGTCRSHATCHCIWSSGPPRD